MMSRHKGIRRFVVVGIIAGLIAGFGLFALFHQTTREAICGLTTDQIMHNVWNQTDNTLKVTVDDIEIASQTNDLSTVLVGDVIDITFYPVTEHSYSAGAGVTQTSGVALANKLLFTGVINGAPNADLWSVDLNNRLEADGGTLTAEMWFWVVAGNGIAGVEYNNIMAEEDVTITSANDVLVFTTDLGGPVSIDVPDGSYTMAEYGVILATTINADNTLTNTQAITLLVDYNVTAESKFTIDATVGHTIAYTFAGSDGDDVIGMWDDIGAAQTIASHIGVPNQLESAVPNTGTAKSVDANRCGTFPSFWDETAFSIKVYMAADETDATCKALDTTAVVVKAITK